MNSNALINHANLITNFVVYLMDAQFKNHTNVLMELVLLPLLEIMDANQLSSVQITIHSYVQMVNVLVIKNIVEFNNHAQLINLLDVLI